MSRNWEHCSLKVPQKCIEAVPVLPRVYEAILSARELSDSLRFPPPSLINTAKTWCVAGVGLTEVQFEVLQLRQRAETAPQRVDVLELRAVPEVHREVMQLRQRAEPAPQRIDVLELRAAVELHVQVLQLAQRSEPAP